MADDHDPVDAPLPSADYAVKPVTFDGCFGFYHSAPGRLGVVICGAQGDEAMTSHRALRRLATELASAGLPTLRFDYRGTGDSAEDDLMPNRMAAWLDSIAAAAAFLLTQEGVTEIALIGLGLGALLALPAAETIASVRRVVLLAPSASGADYLRQIRLRSKLYENHEDRYIRAEFRGTRPGSLSGIGGIECLGVSFQAQTVHDLERLHLPDIVSGSDRLILLLRDARRLAGDELAAQLRAAGCGVEEQDFSGHTEMMRGPAEGVYPAAAFSRVVSWLASAAAIPGYDGLSHHRAGIDTTVLPTSPAAATVTAGDCHSVLRVAAAVHRPSGEKPDMAPSGITETACFVGVDNAMFGIICRPDRPAPELPALVFLNTWWHHHAGIGRLSVTASRRFAAAGYTSFRFDLRGTGDSSDVADGEDWPHLMSCVGDVQSALDRLHQLGHDTFVLVGLCWGASLAAQVSARHHRVVGQILINVRALPEENGTHFDPVHTPVHTLLVLSGCDPGVPHLQAKGLLRPQPQGETGATIHDRVRVAVIDDSDHSFRYRMSREKLLAVMESHLGWLHRSMWYAPPQAVSGLTPGMSPRTDP